MKDIHPAAPVKQSIDPRTIKIPPKKVGITTETLISDTVSTTLPREESTFSQNLNSKPLAGTFSLDKALPLKPESFPDKPRPGSTRIPTTIPNVEHLLSSYQIVAGYNVIKKKLIIHIPGLTGTVDNADNVAISYIISLANLNGIATGRVPEFVEAIADRNQINPVADWITSKPWDGVDRLQDIYDTLVTQENYPEALKQVLMRRWLISAVAAALKPRGFKGRGVLTRHR